MTKRGAFWGVMVVVAVASGLALVPTAQAATSPGDMNCDGVVNGLDIPLFVACLVNNSCGTGNVDCDGNPGNGCETDINTSVNNCGGCGNVCNLPNAVSVCVGGVCAIGACNTGFADCNLNPADGCEVNTFTNVANCSACGNVCPARPNATPVCVGGTCSYICNPGYFDCDGNPANGCEQNILADPTNCGGCNNICTVPNGIPFCAGGNCVIAGCFTGFANCDGNPSNGCETNTNNNLLNCGGCNIVCPNRPNSIPVCTAGICGFICSPGFRDCDGIPVNGCETNINTDEDNCGNCGVNCNPFQSCTGGTCN